MADEALKVNEDFIGDLGTKKKGVRKGAIGKFWDAVVKDMQQAITNKHGAGQLVQTVKPKEPIIINNNGFTLVIEFAKYGDFINEGVNGRKSVYATQYSYKDKKPPVNSSDIGGSSLKQWAESKGLNPYAVRESIFQKGIKPSHWLDEYLETKFNDTVRDFESELAVEIENNFFE